MLKTNLTILAFYMSFINIHAVSINTIYKSLCGLKLYEVFAKGQIVHDNKLIPAIIYREVSKKPYLQPTTGKLLIRPHEDFVKNTTEYHFYYDSVG